MIYHSVFNFYLSLDWEGCVTPGVEDWPLEDMVVLRKQLADLRANKILTAFLNTGRPAPYAEACCQTLGMREGIVPHIVENGSVFYIPKTGEWHTNTRITSGTIRQLKEVEGRLKEYTDTLGIFIELGKAFSCSVRPPAGVLMEDFFQDIYALCNTEGIEITHSNSAVDITITGVNKGSGMREWCEKTGIGLERVAAIGDSDGDLPVLRMVKYPLCPSNGSPKVQALVRERGGIVSRYPSTFGVIDCIRQLIA